jgi:hypothetical protein
MSSGCQCGQCGPTHVACVNEYQYAVKVVCGEVKPAENTPVAPGRYWTAVNIHNPDKCKDANFRLKIGIAQLSLQSPVSQYWPIVPPTLPLRPDGMIELDCPFIRAFAALAMSPPPTFIKGYLVIASDIELDVVAVYTGAAGSAGGNSFHTERVPARCVPVCEDLLLPLDTGIAKWQTTAPAPTGPVVPLSGLPTTWVGAQYGFHWVSQAAGDSSNATVAWRRYELCFDLCDGFVRPQAAIPIHVLADSNAEVSMNGTGPLGNPGNVGSIANPGYQAPHLLNINPALLHAGHNCLRVDVYNKATHPPNPTGFAVTGLLNIARGKCPCAPLPILPPRTGDGPTHTTADHQQKTMQTLLEQIHGKQED